MTTKTTSTAGKTAKAFGTIALACGLLFTNCKKADAGPKGDTGAQGPTGATGQTGASGTNGNAIVYGYKFNVPLASFVGPLTNGQWEYGYDPTALMGGSTFIGDKDVVLLYLFEKTVGATDYYSAMPYADYFNTGTAFNQHSFQVGATGTANIIILAIRNSTGGQPYTSMTTGSLSYKMVYIKASNKVAPTLPTNLDYASVKAFYNLKD